MNENEIDPNITTQNNFEEFIENFAALLNKYKIKNHIICCIHPDKLNDPIVHYSDEYESAKLVAHAHKLLKQIIIDKIN